MIIIGEMSCHMQMLESHTRGTAARASRLCMSLLIPLDKRARTKGYIHSLSITWFTLEMDLLFQEKKQEANSRAWIVQCPKSICRKRRELDNQLSIGTIDFLLRFFLSLQLYFYSSIPTFKLLHANLTAKREEEEKNIFCNPTGYRQL